MAENKDAVTGETHAAPEAVPQAPSDPSPQAVEAEAAPAAEQASAEAQADDKATMESSRPELPENDMSFAEMFELAEKQSAERRKKEQEKIGGDIRPGQVVFAKIVSIAGDDVFLDIGAKAEGVISKQELQEEDGSFPYTEGDKVEARVRKYEGGVVMLSKVLPHQSLKNREELKEAYRSGMPVEGRVTDKNKGGFDVVIAGMRAFCPNSQIDLRAGPAENYIGRKYPFQITEFKQDGKNIVVSRRKLLIEENKRKAEAILSTLEVGGVVFGKVTTVKDYGAFIDIGGLEGLVHLSEITHGHINKPKDFLQVGQDVQAKILKIEDGKGDAKKISLSLKALEEDPWAAAKSNIKEGMKITGKVARIQAFGAFVEIFPGVDGLIHISNLSNDRRLKDPREVVKEGDEVEATVVSIDWDKRRIGLSMVKSAQELAKELRGNKGSQQVLEGEVDRIEGFGLFVKLPNGSRGLVPASETGTQRGADLKKEFALGTKVKVLVLDVEAKTGKIRLSIRAAREAEERAEFAGYLNQNNEKGKGLGTLGDLLKARLGDKLSEITKN
ncbi:MAG: S1 RNA-binding domain-containing protein [Myxococcales bacterium]|nr:S1 RNA-binding domain-containing protein [Myxococcales bacterium]MCB9652302.1 S1 RNA-binding domain-containing protein [Deltaproteobacteria bacterium]